jgi:phospholipase D1/2
MNSYTHNIHPPLQGQSGALASHPATPDRPSLFEAGRNCWRVESAARASFLIDGAAYFKAFRDAAKEAQHSIVIIGWDFDSRIPMLIEREPDGFPDRLGRFLHSLLKRRRKLRVYVLVWDFHMIYWREREWWLPSQFLAHRRLHFLKDAMHPLGASHHQKVVVIDDAVAFAGGIDLAQCRWDTPGHTPRHPDRRLFTDGGPCRPFHDVQMMVDGAAAAALGELARDRWIRAGGRPMARPPSFRPPDLWPASTEPDLINVRVAIARTIPEFGNQKPVNEVERLMLDSCAAARRHIYIETQYLTSDTVANCLAQRLQEPDGPEIVVILHPNSDGWLEQHTMDVLRGRVLARLRAVDRFHRLALYYPRLPDLQGQCISMHSKVCIVDDEIVRVGSANLSNRSMGFDTECDLAIEAGGDQRIQERIAAFRHRLMGEHLDVNPEMVESDLARGGSLINTVECLRGGGRSLAVFDGSISAEVDEVVPDAEFIDPSRPYPVQLLPSEQRRPARRQLIAGGVGLLLLFLLAAFWQWAPVREQFNVESMVAFLDEFAQGPMAAPVAISAFVVGGFLVMPVILLIAVTVLTFGAWWGFLYALVGMTLSALLTFWIGRLFGRRLMDRFAGSRIDHVSRALASKGILGVVTLRILPIAPFSIVNVVAGASHIGAREFFIGTILGELPGLLSLAFFVDQINETIRHPDIWGIALLAVIVGAIVLSGMRIRRWLSDRASVEDNLVHYPPNK